MSDRGVFLAALERLKDRLEKERHLEEQLLAKVRQERTRLKELAQERKAALAALKQERLERDRTEEKFVAVHFFPHEPMQVYGMFDSEEAAREYAERQGFAMNGGAYDVFGVLDVNEEE